MFTCSVSVLHFISAVRCCISQCTCGCARRRLQVFQVDIHRLSIEPSENCAGDRLQLFDGDEDTPLSEPMCGQDPPSETFTSRSSVLVVRFQSDQGGTDAGFVLQYAVVAAELDQADVQAATDQPTGSQGDARRPCKIW